jgi:GH15 family glucan-1,4-alpha-glucosidase
MMRNTASLRIEDYAMIGDCETAALVGTNGSIDWLCVPRFDSPSCFAALLGNTDHGRWLIAPTGGARKVTRQYRDGTLILETEFETDGGSAKLIDFMPLRSEAVDVVRIVEGVRGHVEMSMDLVIRFDYGASIPWVRRIPGGIHAVGGPDALRLRTPVDTHGENFHTVSKFTVSPGQRVHFVLTWFPSHHPIPGDRDPLAALKDCEEWWRIWSDQCSYRGPWRDVVVRSAITLKALTYMPTGGLVAAATTSLPETPGGERNWDYRYCWLRDATFTLYALMTCGYMDEASAWRDWLLRAVAGEPSEVQIMYGLAGERRLREFEVASLPGYLASKPVRVGNAAYRQFQLDVFGELMDSLHVARGNGLPPDENAWAFQKALMRYLEAAWSEPDEGIWEVRGPRRHFTHSKVMAWVAFDRAVKAVERFEADGPVEHWRRLRDTIHRQVCEEGFNANINSFVQYYGAQDVDASLLMIPLVGFLPASDPRVKGTVHAIQQQLVSNGFVTRYREHPEVDGLTGREGAFLLCTLWMADNLALQGRMQEATELFNKVLAVRNDVGLLSEQYDPLTRRLLGNFPQAFSHVGLINTARNLARAGGPAEERTES